MDNIKTVLLVDDDIIVLNMLIEHLANNLKNINILTSNNSKDALKYLLNKDLVIHAAVIDYRLPDCVDGYIIEYCIKKDIPTVVLTGTMNEHTRKTVIKKDIVDIIVKNDSKSFITTSKTIDRILKNYDNNVLIVDDSKIQLKIIHDILKRMKLNITLATDGDTALRFIEDHPKKFSLLLTDYHMPKMNGMELTMKIREKYDKDELSIIVLSANKEEDIPTQFLKIGANDFLHKPYSQLEVITRVNSNLHILELFEQTRDMANKDFMTGSYNRRYFFESGESLFDKAKRKKEDLCVAMFDIDKFKNINDTYGHDVGDIAIQEMANVLSKHFRKSDLIARFGGEEFCVLLENISLDDSKILFEKIRAYFENNSIQINSKDINYTVSIGVFYGLDNNLEEMIKKADEGLYICKNNGRNQVSISS